MKSAPFCCSKSSDDSLPSSLLCLRALPLCGAEYQSLPSRSPCSKIRLQSRLLWVSALPSSLASSPWTSFPSLCFLIWHVVSRLPRVAPGALHELDLSHLLGLFLVGWRCSNTKLQDHALPHLRAFSHMLPCLECAFLLLHLANSYFILQNLLR